jgi:hypothetical protein
LRAACVPRSVPTPVWRRSGAGGFRSVSGFWRWAGQGSNLRPMDYESTALTAELPARRAGFAPLTNPRWSTDGRRGSRSTPSYVLPERLPARRSTVHHALPIICRCDLPPPNHAARPGGSDQRSAPPTTRSRPRSATACRARTISCSAGGLGAPRSSSITCVYVLSVISGECPSSSASRLRWPSGTGPLGRRRWTSGDRASHR